MMRITTKITSPSVLLLSLLVSLVEAKDLSTSESGSKPDSPSISSQVRRKPLNTAVLAFFAIFTIWTFIHLIIGVLRLREEKVHRSALKVSLLAIFLHLSTYIMRAIYVGEGLLKPKGSSKINLAVRSYSYAGVNAFLLLCANIAITAAVLLVVDKRARLSGKQMYPPVTFASWKVYLDIGLFFITTVFSACFAAVFGSLKSHISLEQNAGVRPAYFATFYVAALLFGVCVADVWGSTVFVNTKMRKFGVEDSTIRRILRFQLPILTLQAISFLINAVINTLPRKQLLSIDYNGYYVAYSIILGFTNISIIEMFQVVIKKAEDPSSANGEDPRLITREVAHAFRVV